MFARPSCLPYWAAALAPVNSKAPADTIDTASAMVQAQHKIQISAKQAVAIVAIEERQSAHGFEGDDGLLLREIQRCSGLYFTHKAISVPLMYSSRITINL